ncbi:MAG: chemotaxis protein CheZ [Deltaproteobacteria bacterium]|jgi:chemotaxis regulatin CheY-phosphate phosphatase CheZ|uniref:protein phosphatase CheZ n=1 Tax=Hydrosulfovibrio ferrireducens TaxID=2934181 RepID=UPI001204ADB9|nr:MAG: chemotaxis protein CheZ [Deltaproteobacteria bacterium]
MSTAGKSEVNLEISAGFFRISTDSVVYNITVLGGSETGATQVVRHILAEEKPAVPSLAAPTPEAGDFDLARVAGEALDDDYYKKVSTDIFNDIGKLAKSLSSTMGEIPMEDRRMKRVELDEAGEKIEDAKNQLHDIVSMTERATMEIMDQVEKVQNQTDGVKDLLLSLKTHSAFQAAAVAAGEEGVQSAAVTLQNLQEKIGQANALIVALQEEGGGAGEEAAAGEVLDLAEAAPETVTRTRYLFALDTIFQTMYELCTNETVKTHITAARKKAGEIFDHNGFVDALGEKIKDLVPDSDNFFTVPLSDVLSALLASCSDQKTQNLLKKMDLNQAEIFLDQSLPLEVPPFEEIEEAVLAPAVEALVSAPAAPAQGIDPRVAEVAGMLAESVDLAGQLTENLAQMRAGDVPGMSLMTIEDQNDIFKKIEDAFQVASSITDDISRITEALSFQDLSGQQILKIIKLLTDFQVQLLAIVVSFGSQLKMKEKNAGITVEESKRIAQEDVDKYLSSMTTGEVGGDGSLDQDAVNDLLKGLGF